MPNGKTISAGSVGWIDLTVDDAAELKDFYTQVVGWTPEAVEMSGYSDFNMNTPDGTPQAGICHRRGPNSAIPPVWIVYFMVSNLEMSLDRVLELGGHLVAGPKRYGPDAYAVIQDPAGAVCALYQPAGQEET